MTNSILLKERSYIFKGQVVSNSNNDPLSLNRVQVWIPQIHGGESPDSNKCGPSGSYPWASCIVMSSSLPTEGAKVAVGFEGNDYNFPIVFGIYSSDTEHLSKINGQGGVENQYAGGSLAEIAAKIIFSNEGSYTSIAWNDHDCKASPKNFTSSCTCINSKSGSISIGKIQWHANRARNLLIAIRELNATKFEEICNKHGAGELLTLLNESISWGSMKNWSNDCPIGKAIKEILGTEESKQAQDDQAIKDVQGYLTTASSGGITDPACLIYLADIINQYGSCSDLVKSGINNLDELYNYSIKHGYGGYEPRRTSTYNKIKEIESKGDLVPSQLSTLDGNTGGTLYWPAPGISAISSYYGMRGAIAGTTHTGANFHNGIDIKTPTGTSIIAVADGEVKISATGYNGGWGNYVVLYHPSINMMSLYAHNSSLCVSVGQQVKAGTVVSKSGNTGNSSGPHLHFSLAKGSQLHSWGSSKTGAGTSVNPLNYVKAP